METPCEHEPHRRELWALHSAERLRSPGWSRVVVPFLQVVLELKHKLRRELNHARIGRRSADCSKGLPAAEVDIWIGEVRSVRRVEKLGPKVKLQPLAHRE